MLELAAVHDGYVVPEWLHALSIAALVVAGVCALVIVIDLLRGHRQQMAIMNVVWPVTALWGGPAALAAYFTLGRVSTRRNVQRARAEGRGHPGKERPFWQSVGLGATHCGSGCTLGDLLAEWGIFFFPFTLFGRHIFAAWVVDYALALLLGVAFQYFTIKPMRDVSPGQGLWQALKADTLSLTGWQVGMYGWMAVATFAIFGHELEKTDPLFWFMMQVAMVCGFLTSYPINWWLLRRGIKEKM